jgi:hypothetical protein
MKIDIDNIKTIAEKIPNSFNDPDTLFNELNINSISKDQLKDYCAAYDILKDNYDPSSEMVRRIIEAYISKENNLI